jgi:hypothetical protein
VTIFAAAVFGAKSGQAAQCDRNCLIKFVDQYLEALVARDPSRLPLAKGIKYTEDTAANSLGDGLWVGVSDGPTTFKVYAADPVTGQAGFFGVLKEWNKPVILALRLKVQDGRISEIEHVLARNLNEADMGNLVRPRTGFVTPVPPSERSSRQEMLRIADSYFDSIEQSDGKVAPFADDCVRVENGRQTTGNPAPDPKAFEGNLAGLTRALVLALGCTAQMSSGTFEYITRIRPRRLLIVDEEMGLVFAFPMFRHRGDARTVKISGVPGVTSQAREVGPNTLQAGELFKIRGGKLHEIEANGVLVPYGSTSGWE